MAMPSIRTSPARTVARSAGDVIIEFTPSSPRGSAVVQSAVFSSTSGANNL